MNKDKILTLDMLFFSRYEHLIDNSIKEENRYTKVRKRK
jgi:hypothetical protein